MREHIVVPSIHSQEVARAQRSGVRYGEDALKALDFGNSLLGVHSPSISDMRMAIVKRSGTCMSFCESVPLLVPTLAENQMSVTAFVCGTRLN